jgi:hypothetical protein
MMPPIFAGFWPRELTVVWRLTARKKDKDIICSLLTIRFSLFLRIFGMGMNWLSLL